MQGIYVFGPFRLDAVERRLWKGDVPVKLTPKEYDFLVTLVRQAGRVVETETLLSEVWPNVTVTDGTVRQTAHRLRRALEDDGAEPLYIKRVTNRGYVFTARISDGAAAAPKTAASRLRRISTGMALAAIAFVLLFAFARTPQRMGAPQRLTRNGFEKYGPMWTDGKRLYFSETIDNRTVLAEVGVAGGKVSVIPAPPFSDPIFLDMRLPGPRFLVRAKDRGPENYIWDWEPGQPPRRLAPCHCDSAAWISSSMYVDDDQGRLRILQDGSVIRIIELPGRAHYPQWSDDRRQLIFQVVDSSGLPSLWQLDGLDGAARRAYVYPVNSRSGAWGSQGLLAFMRNGPKGDDIWAAIPKSFPVGHKSIVQVTDGLLDYDWPRPSLDGHQIFAIGRKNRGELVAFDPATNRFKQYLNGLEAVQLNYSPDGGWVAYINHPQRELWKSRADGRDVACLVAAPMEVAEPHWSPNGSEIAFMGKEPGKPYQIYIVPSTGGEPPRLASPGPAAQGVPTWSREGRSIVFGDLQGGPPESMTIHILDLNRKAVSKLPRSDGLWSPRWSPDGTLIAALTSDNRQLKAYDLPRQTWNTLVELSNIDFVHWSPDSRYLYFRAAIEEKSLGHTARKFICKLDVSRREFLRLADLDGFSYGAEEWWGITPGGLVLGFQGVSNQDIYAIPIP